MQSSLFNIPRIRSILPLATASLFLASWVPTASARLFLDPAGGIVLASAASTPGLDDSIIGVGLVPINYFGEGMHLVSAVSVNGNLFYADDFSIISADDSFLSPLGMSGYNQISPFWQDLNLGSTGVISLLDNDDFTYSAVTWENVELTYGTAGVTGSFQAIIFGASTTLEGTTFQAGDIIFSYQGMDALFSETNDRLIGIQSENGSIAYDPANSGYGWYFDAFPYANNEYLLFRRNGMSYDVSVETMQAIPEPSTVAALLSGSLLIGWQAFRRRRG